MKKIFITIFILACFHSTGINAGSTEFIAGINYQTFDSQTQYDDIGASVKLRYFNFPSGNNFRHGLFGAADFPAMSVFVFDAMIGYALRTGGDAFFDLGIAYAYSPIWGPRPVGVLGFGVNMTGKWYLSFPITVSAYGGVTIIPMIGYNF